MKIAVVDASVAVKWVVDEEDADSAAWLLLNAGTLIAPAHWLAEATNALWTSCTLRGELSREEALAGIS